MLFCCQFRMLGLRWADVLRWPSPVLRLRRSKPAAPIRVLTKDELHHLWPAAGKHGLVLGSLLQGTLGAARAEALLKRQQILAYVSPHEAGKCPCLVGCTLSRLRRRSS